VVLGAAGAVGWLTAAAFAVQSLPQAIRNTGGWLRRLPSRSKADGEGITVREVALSWLLVPVSILTLVVATLLLPLLLVRGVLSVLALFKERERALRLRRAAERAADERAVFVSYRTARHGPDALAVSQALEAAERPAWLDAEHGVLPTHLFFIDHVLEDAVRSARAVVVLRRTGDEDGGYAETFVDRTDLVLATGLRWILFMPFAFAGFVILPVLVVMLPFVVMLAALVPVAEQPSRPPRRRSASMVPSELRAWWYRSLTGADITRREGERWQAWEQRLASLYGLPTVTVAVVDDPRDAPPDADVVLARSTIGRDVRRLLVPALAAAKPDPTAPLALAHTQMHAARAMARAHPLRTLWRAAAGGRNDDPAVAALARRVAGEADVARSFTRDGHAVLRRFLDQHEVDVLRDEVGRALAAPRAPSCERPHNTLVPLRWDDAVVDRVLSEEGRMRRLAAVADGDDLRWISGYLSLKEPDSPALWWHQDWWAWDHPLSFESRAPQVALLCYLTATDEDSAALRVLPGSHREATDLHTALPEAHAQAVEDLDPSHPAMSAHPEQVTVTVSPGDAVVVDYRLLHGTHPNRGATRRDCVLLTFAPSWRTLPPEIRGHLIRHPALPGDGEVADRPWARRRLPSYDGPRADLPLNRAAFPG
jgi:hypothetical protein